MARLKNVCGGVRGLGGSPKGKHSQGVVIKPNETVKLTPEQVALFKDPKQPHHKVLADMIRKNELLDVDDEFNELLGLPVKEPEEVEQPTPAAHPSGSLEAESGVAALVKLPEDKALAAVLDVNDIPTLREWFTAETRQTVREQINKRGAYLAQQQKG